MRSLSIVSILSMMLPVVLSGCDNGPDLTVAMGTLEVDRIDIAVDSAEPFVAIDVIEGQRVEAGQVLARQDGSRIRAALKAAEAELAVARARLREAEAGPRAQDIAAARAQVAAAKSEVKTTRIELERERSLVRQKYASQNQVDILEGRYEAALARQEEAEALLDQLLEGTRSEEIDAARSSYAMAEAKVEDIRISLARTSIEAPVAGLVETIVFEVGERPQLGGTAVTLLAHQTPYARVHVPEQLRTKLAPGAPAIVTIDGHDRDFDGKLRWIAHDASFTPYYALTQHDRSHLSYLAEVDVVDDAVPDVATGVPVEVRFPGAE